MDYEEIIRALLLFLSFAYATAFKSSNISCPDAERAALLKFVGDFNKTAADFSSWEGKDCCKWEGVECDDRTGHVVHLDLRGRGIAGSKFNPALLRLKQLSYLDLSRNNFEHIPIPPWIGSFKKLNYLNLSWSNFVGIPDQLGNLSRLQIFDLSDYAQTLSNAHWLSQLTSLLHIDMSYSYIRNASNWLQALNILPSVQEIHASCCVFGNFPQSLPHVNFSTLSLLDLSLAFIWDFSNNSGLPDWLFRITSLQYLYLSGCEFTGPIPSSLSNLCELRTLDLSYSTINSQLDALEAPFSGCLKNSLQELDLSGTSLSGNIPDWIGDLNNLSILHLSFNSLSGSIPASLGKLSKIQELSINHNNLNGNIPDWIGDLNNLTILDLSFNSHSGSISASLGKLSKIQALSINRNKLNGTVSESLGNLNELTFLDLSSNSLVGVMSEHHFSNLTRLYFMNLSFNSLDMNVSYDWVPPFQLTELYISGCKLGPKFPSWLQTQKSLKFLDLSSAGISDSVPNWFWNSMANLSVVLLANNELRGGEIPNLIKFNDDFDLYIDLSSNFFEGPVPRFSSNTEYLDLSNNSFSGHIPYDIFQLMPNLSVLLLSMNKINGRIPMSICNSNLISISISSNHLSGELPNCQNHTTYLEYLDLSNNNLSGGIPKWLCDLPSFQFLLLRNNNLSGELSPFLNASKGLQILDLGRNMFTGRIPTWLGELSSLRILSLTSNCFVGQIPTKLSNLTLLQILDLSNNNLLGPIPMSFGDFVSMRTPLKNDEIINTRGGYYEVSMILDIKGRIDRYNHYALSLITILDLSRNSLSGYIPGELTNLLGLLILDLSSNDLTGQIPFKIGDLTQLEWLDLSRNKLLGSIPSSLSNLSFLGFLNLSYNNFSGRIPTGKQMDTFVDPKIYIGNQYLCGFQINVTCGQLSRRPGSDVSANVDENRKEILLICLITIAGFAVGFWAIIGVLLVDKRFRVWWFLYVDSLYDSLYVTSKVYFARLQKKMTKTNTIDS